MYSIVLLVFGTILGILQITVMKTEILSAFLLGYLVSNVGIQGIFAFFGHFFKSDEVAKRIGWSQGNPFQKEIAFANLSMGFLGIMCIWFRGEFWLATIVVRSVFTWGAGYIHVLDLRKRKNTSVFNSGPVLYFDLLFPCLLIALYIAFII